MPVTIEKITGTYHSSGNIRLENGALLKWSEVCHTEPPKIPDGIKMEIHLAFEAHDFLNGKDGFVWATYDQLQAETICNALQAQNIPCHVQETSLTKGMLFTLEVPEPGDIEKAIDFIWRDSSGLSLRPDWEYEPQAVNESFNKWISAI